MTSSPPARKGHGPRIPSVSMPTLAAVPATGVPDQVDPVGSVDPEATSSAAAAASTASTGSAATVNWKGSAPAVPPVSKSMTASATPKVEAAVDEVNGGGVERVTVRMPPALFDDLMAGMARTFGNHPRAARRARIRTGLNAYAVAALRAGIVALEGLSEDEIVDLLRQDSGRT